MDTDYPTFNETSEYQISVILGDTDNLWIGSVLEIGEPTLIITLGVEATEPAARQWAEAALVAMEHGRPLPPDLYDRRHWR